MALSVKTSQGNRTRLWLFYACSVGLSSLLFWYITFDIVLTMPLALPYGPLTPLVVGSISGGFWLCGLINYVTDPRRRIAFLLYMFDWACAFIIIAGMPLQSQSAIALVTDMCFVFAPLILWHTLLDRATEICGQERQHRWESRMLSLWYGIVALFAFGYIVGYLFFPDVQHWLSWTAFDIFNLSSFFVLGWLGVVYRRATNAFLRNQFRVMLVGLAIPSLPILLLFFLPNLIFGQFSLDLPYLFPLGLAIPLTFFYGIRRQRLTSLDLKAARWILLCLIFGSVALIYAQLITGVGYINRGNVFANALWLGILGLALAAITVVLAQRHLVTYIDRIVYGTTYDYHATYNQLIAALFGLTDPESLGNVLCRDLSRILHPRGVAFLINVDDPQKPANFRLVTAVGALSSLDETQINRIERAVAATTPHTRVREMLANGPALCQPLVSRNQWRGILVLGPKASGSLYSNTDLHLLDALAHEISLALENTSLVNTLHQQISQLQEARQEARLLSQQLAQVQDEERETLSYRLHDGVLQNLIFLARQSAFCADNLRDQRLAADKIATYLSQLQTIADESIQDLRNICRGLNPLAVETVGLLAALRWLADSTLELHGVQTLLDIEESAVETPFPRLTERSLFTLMHEAVTNAVKHAKAQHIWLRLYRTPQGFCMAVQDDGCGMAVPPNFGQLAGTGHMGLIGMRVRAERLGGLLQVTSVAGAGTTITIDLPLSVCSDGPDSWPGEPQGTLKLEAISTPAFMH